MKLKKLLSLEWDAIAGVLAAVIGIILHLLHIVDDQIVLPIVLALMALLFINFMRHTVNNETTAEEVDRIAHSIRHTDFPANKPVGLNSSTINRITKLTANL